MTNKDYNMTEIKVKAYAKINLFLDITGVLPNGYHSLNNIMQQIELHDEVTVALAEGNGISIVCNSTEIPCDKRNIAYKAAELFLKETGLSSEIKINIKKNIPVMAGLGGSSTDGAAVLSALNRLSKNVLSEKDLESMGAMLGADLPFCIRGNTALCKGIGEKMQNICGLPRCTILIIKPDFSCSTATAYKLYDQMPLKSVGEPQALLSALQRGNLNDTGKNLYNIFELLYNDPRIIEIKQKLLELGAVGAALSGSGSAVYGIFAEEEKALAAMSKLNYIQKFITKPIFLLEK